MLTGGKNLQAKLAGISSKMTKGKHVRVGFLESATYPDGTNVAQVAFWNEYGTITAPPRPFFRTMIASESPSWPGLMARAAKNYNYDADLVLAFMGTKISEDLQQSIVGWTDPANAPSTVKKKGFDKPLIETGHMQRSVDFEVK